MKLLREIAKFVAWLSGSIAGIGAILYLMGYLVVLSHLYRLGIGPLPGYDHRLYLEHGGRFLLDLVNIHLLPVLLLVSLAAILVMGLATLMRGWARRHKHRLSRLHYAAQRLREHLSTLHGEALAYGLLLVLFLLVVDPALELLRRPLAEVDLLFVEQTILLNNEATQNELALILGYELLILLFLILATRLTRNWRRRTLGMAPFVLVALVCLMLLPVSYGALVIDLRHHPVTLKPKPEGGPHYLITATDSLLVIWDRGRKKVLWIPQNRLEALELDGRVDIFPPIENKPEVP